MKEDKPITHGPHGEGCTCPWPTDTREIKANILTDLVSLPGDNINSLIDVFEKLGTTPEDMKAMIAKWYPREVEITFRVRMPGTNKLSDCQNVLDNLFGRYFQKVVSAKDLSNGETCTEFK